MKKKKGFRDKDSITTSSSNHFFIYSSTTDSPSPPPKSTTTTPPTSAEPVVSSSSSSFWSGFVSSAFSIFDSSSSSSSHSGGGVLVGVDSSSSAAAAPPPTAADFEKKTEITTTSTRNNNVSSAWRSAVKRLLSSGGGSGVMRRFQERLLGAGGTKTGISSCSPTSDIWFLGVCYQLSLSLSSSPEDYNPPSPPSGANDSINNNNSIDTNNNNNNNNHGSAAFEYDFSSRILMTYRKGFKAIEDSKYTSDVNWGCMLRSGQMLVAQALLFHRLGRSWRKPFHKPMDREYIEILHLFGDTDAAPFSIHNLLQAGKAYGLAAGSWVGPYAMCRSWETLVRSRREESDNDSSYSLPMAVYIVSGDEDGARGGAPVVCIEDASRQCLDFSKGQLNWTPILLLVPLVLGLDKVNPRYIPLLGATFTFPQSLGILGGKPGASTYIVGVQDEKAFYLDPHEVQPVVDISKNNLEADTSSYHCNVIRHIPLDLIDPSLAIGFYCRDKDDFDDFCSRASKLADQSNGAPLFTVTETHNLQKPVNHNDMLGDSATLREDESYDVVPMSNSEGHGSEDDWQLL